MKILLVDDHALVREGTVHLLRRLTTDAEIHEAGDCATAYALVAQIGDPDLILLDLSMPDAPGLEALSRLRELAPATPIIVLSATEDGATVHAALNRGAKGYIPKSAPANVIAGAIQLVMGGGVYLPQTLLEAQREAGPAIGDPTQGAALTPRQRDVLSLLVLGKTNKEIGRALGMSDSTVRTHVTTIFRILKVNNRTQAGHVVSRMKLLDAEPDVER